jgi:hypothetical protein
MEINGNHNWQEILNIRSTKVFEIFINRIE